MGDFKRMKNVGAWFDKPRHTRYPVSSRHPYELTAEEKAEVMKQNKARGPEVMQLIAERNLTIIAGSKMIRRIAEKKK
jgi:hypothetical protein